MSKARLITMATSTEHADGRITFDWVVAVRQGVRTVRTPPIGNQEQAIREKEAIQKDLPEDFTFEQAADMLGASVLGGGWEFV